VHASQVDIHAASRRIVRYAGIVHENVESSKHSLMRLHWIRDGIIGGYVEVEFENKRVVVSSERRKRFLSFGEIAHAEHDIEPAIEQLSGDL
jgi:hypothetical protein